MPSRRRRARLRRLILLSMTPAVSACAGIAPMTATPSAWSCAALIPPGDREPVRAVPLPVRDATAGALWMALDGQTARLDLANGRLADVEAIVDRCEANRAALTPAPRPGLFGWLKR